MKHFIEGEKIYLRPFARSDISTWFDWFNDPLITEYMNKGVFPNTKSAQEEYFETLLKSKKDLQLAVILKKSDLLIGIVGIHKIDWIHRYGDVSILIGNDRLWGKGIAKESVKLIIKHAFTKMNLRRLTAGMSALNTGSRRCFEDNGFLLEGTRRKHFWYKNGYIDEYMFGLLREEWEKKSRKYR